MANFFLFAISAIICAGAWFISRGRFGRFGIYLGRFFIAGALVGASSAFTGKEEFVINTFIGNSLLGFVFINIGTIIYHRFSTILEGALTFFSNGESENDNGHLRGARLVTGKQLQKILKKEQGDLTIGSQKIPERLEALHFLIAGSTGVGKSVAICEVLDGIAARGDRVFLSDAGGNFLKAYYNEERHDLILNPLDSRAINWSPLAEIKSVWDVDQIAKSIIPDAEGSGAEWNGYAQTIIAAILKHCWQSNLTNADIFKLATVADIKELREIFAGTPAQPFTEEGNERMFGSVRAIVGRYISPFQYLEADAGVENGFSLKDIVASEKAKGWLFFNFRDDQLETLKPIIAAMADIISKTILSMEESKTRKFWMIIDEFASLGRIGSILDFLTKARKNGGRAILGLQTVSQLEIPYTRAEAHTILANCSSQVVFRVPDPETSDVMSRLLGEAQISRIVASGGESENKSFQQVFGSKSKNENWQQQITNDRIVLPGELQNLETLHGFLNFAGSIPTAPILLEPVNRPQTAATFEQATREAIKIKPAIKVMAETKQAEVNNISDSDLPPSMEGDF